MTCFVSFLSIATGLAWATIFIPTFIAKSIPHVAFDIRGNKRSSFTCRFAPGPCSDAGQIVDLINERGRKELDGVKRNSGRVPMGGAKQNANIP